MTEVLFSLEKLVKTTHFLKGCSEMSSSLFFHKSSRSVGEKVERLIEFKLFKKSH